ncbi:alcohol dehydrogenase catalytic domain-containing protein [Streptomyces sp. NPDC056390]|uniref:alcohol dehydrogenase catalytic domain-containing protein n=1 Tax=Streptomyces sp. NPDC056390 TaxID=3345806 RepID=UPI0035E1AC41
MSETIVALSRSASEPFELVPAQLLGPRDGEVLLRVEACGVCHTDMEGRAVLASPCVVGHEVVGVVESVAPDVSDYVVGDRVIASYPHCGECSSCRTGRPFHCRDVMQLIFGGARADGSPTLLIDGEPAGAAFFQQSGFATHALVPERSLVPAPADIPSQLLAALPCGIQTGAGAVFNVFAPSSRDSLVVFGAGAVGLAAVMAASVVGMAKVVAVDLVDDRLDLAKELGATRVVHAGKEDVNLALRSALPDGARFVLDTVGIDATWQQAIACIGVGGTFGYVTIPRPEATYSVHMSPLFERFVTLQAIHNGSAVPRDFLPKLESLYRSGQFPIDRLVRAYPFDQIDKAFADAGKGQSVKPVLVMEGF